MELELNTFGAVLEYAMHLEDESARFYEAAARLAQAANLVEVFNDLAADAAKRRKTLERVRRENVTEMILNPIHDFASRDYAPSFAAEGDDAHLKQAAVQLEEAKARFYATAKAKTELAETARALGRLGQGGQQSAERLASIALA